MIVREIGRAYAQAIPGLEILMLQYSTSCGARNENCAGIAGKIAGGEFCTSNLGSHRSHLISNKKPVHNIFLVVQPVYNQQSVRDVQGD